MYPLFPIRDSRIEIFLPEWEESNDKLCEWGVEPLQSLSFDYSHSGKKISILESLIGKSGYISVVCQTMTALEIEDFVLLSGVTDDGTTVDVEQCRRFFSLNAAESPVEGDAVPTSLQAALE